MGYGEQEETEKTKWKNREKVRGRKKEGLERKAGYEMPGMSI